MPMNLDYYQGLNARLEIPLGPRTPRSSEDDKPFYLQLMTHTNEVSEISSEMVFPFPAADCFELMKDYRRFLLTHLKSNVEEAKEGLGIDLYAKPTWIKAGKDGEYGSEGSLVQYAYYEQSVVFWMVDKVTTLDDGTERDANGHKIYRFAMETQWDQSFPEMPMHGHGTYMIFTTHNNDANKCHLTWIRKWDKPYILGLVPMNQMFVTTFEGKMYRDMQILWEVFHNNFSPRLPKKDSKVVVVGAGPSGLHMTYEMIQRGMPVENIKILEKDTRYGGKTLSIPSDSNVQISNAQYNPPPPKLSAIPSIKERLIRYYKCKTLRDCVQYFLTSGSLTGQEYEDIKRQNTPNALKKQEDDQYFAGGETIFHELGTCYLSPGYYALRTMLKEIQAQVVTKSQEDGNEQGDWSDMADADITREVGPDTYAIESERWDGKKTLEQWITYEGGRVSSWDDVCNCSPATQYVAINASVMAAKLKYCKLHCQYLGNYYYTLPPRPSDLDMEDLQLSFHDFLEKNNLLTMEPLFTYALTAQGYGIIKKTPTFLAMQWLTPDLLDGYFEWYYYFMTYKDAVGEITSPIPEELQKFDNFRKGMLVSGWGGVWDRIVKLFDLESILEKEVTIKNITRNGGKVQVQYTRKDNTDVDSEFDFLIVAAPVSDPTYGPEHDITTDRVVRTLPLDLDSKEEELFVSQHSAAGVFRTNLFLPEVNGKYEADHLRIFIDAIMTVDSETKSRKKIGDGDAAGRGDVFGVRDSYKAIQPRLSTPGGNEYDPTVGSPREKMCYQYVSPDNIGKGLAKEEVLNRKLKQFFEEHTEYFTNAVPGELDAKIDSIITRFKSWTYYTHFEKEGLIEGLLWKILDVQGAKNTLFVHASTNFESVLDIVNYNNMLMDGISGKLDSTARPPADTRPAPWQRPQVLLFERLLLHKVIRHLLNFAIFIIWTIWYVVSYPLAEGIYLRYQRYKLQEAFKTPDLGHFMSYTQSYFNNVSPTTRGYMDYIRGIPNGIPDPIPDDFDPFVWDDKLGPGDTVFKILQDPKSGFRDKFPNIPSYKEIPTSIFWNLTDFRVGVRHWLTTFEDTFHPLLTPQIQTIIQTFSYYCPNYYSWIFSWLFASQFRLLIGFSYRFEDEKGGGLRIPECSMLKTAIKDHGMEVGQRICLTICKIFTEEVMKSKKMQIDFQPDFLDGGGLGCRVRMQNPMEHAYSNHSLWESFRTNEEKEKFKNIDTSW